MKSIQHIMNTLESGRMLAQVASAWSPALQSLRSLSVVHSHQYSYCTTLQYSRKELKRKRTPKELLPCVHRGTWALSVGMTGLGMGSIRGMAGHNKWSNIKHIKAAKDSEKQKVILSIVNRMRAHVKATGQYDPKKSAVLTQLIAEAKSKNVPSSVVDNVLEKLLKMKDAPPRVFEAKGPSGSVMLIETATSRPKQTRGEVQSIIKKCGFTISEGAGNLAQMVFEEKGVVEVSMDQKATPDMDHYVELAIEAGAEDVTLTDADGAKVLQFVCAPQDTQTVRQRLEKQELEVVSADVVFNAHSEIALPPAVIEAVDKVMVKLDSHPDIISVHSNFGASL